MNCIDKLEEVAKFRGLENQLLKLAEEAAEVAQAAIKFKMNPNDSTFAKLGEELADFEIIHEQIQYLCPDLESQEGLYRPFKIEREVLRMERAKEKTK